MFTGDSLTDDDRAPTRAPYIGKSSKVKVDDPGPEWLQETIRTVDSIEIDFENIKESMIKVYYLESINAIRQARKLAHERTRLEGKEENIINTKEGQAILVNFLQSCADDINYEIAQMLVEFGFVDEEDKEFPLLYRYSDDNNGTLETGAPTTRSRRRTTPTPTPKKEEAAKFEDLPATVDGFAQALIEKTEPENAPVNKSSLDFVRSQIASNKSVLLAVISSVLYFTHTIISEDSADGETDYKEHGRDVGSVGSFIAGDFIRWVKGEDLIGGPMIRLDTSDFTVDSNHDELYKLLNDEDIKNLVLLRDAADHMDQCSIADILDSGSFTFQNDEEEYTVPIGYLFQAIERHQEYKGEAQDLIAEAQRLFLGVQTYVNDEINNKATNVLENVQQHINRLESEGIFKRMLSTIGLSSNPAVLEMLKEVNIKLEDMSREISDGAQQQLATNAGKQDGKVQDLLVDVLYAGALDNLIKQDGGVKIAIEADEAILRNFTKCLLTHGQSDDITGGQIKVLEKYAVLILNQFTNALVNFPATFKSRIYMQEMLHNIGKDTSEIITDELKHRCVKDMSLNVFRFLKLLEIAFGAFTTVSMLKHKLSSQDNSLSAVNGHFMWYMVHFVHKCLEQQVLPNYFPGDIIAEASISSSWSMATFGLIGAGVGVWPVIDRLRKRGVTSITKMHVKDLYSISKKKVTDVDAKCKEIAKGIVQSLCRRDIDVMEGRKDALQLCIDIAISSAYRNENDEDGGELREWFEKVSGTDSLDTGTCEGAIKKFRSERRIPFNGIAKEYILRLFGENSSIKPSTTTPPKEKLRQISMEFLDSLISNELN